MAPTKSALEKAEKAGYACSTTEPRRRAKPEANPFDKNVSADEHKAWLKGFEKGLADDEE